jgi:hypothetical protein
MQEMYSDFMTEGKKGKCYGTFLNEKRAWLSKRQASFSINYPLKIFHRFLLKCALY